MPLSPADEAILRRMIADYRRYGIKKAAVAPIQVFEEVDGQKLGLDLAALGEATAGTYALLIAEDAGPPVRYQYREITSPNDGGDSAANTSYDMILGGTTGYAYEVDNRKCAVVADPGAGTYTADPWLVAVVKIYTVGTDNYFTIDQTAQDDKAGWVSPTDQRWAGGRKTVPEGWYEHPTGTPIDPAYTAAGVSGVTGTYLGYAEADGLLNTGRSVSPPPNLLQAGIIRRDASIDGTTRVWVAELVDRGTYTQWPQYVLTAFVAGVTTYSTSGPTLYAEEVRGSGSSFHSAVWPGGVCTAKDSGSLSARWGSPDAAGLSAQGPMLFLARPVDAATERHYGPSAVVGGSDSSDTTKMHGITRAKQLDAYTDMNSSPPLAAAGGTVFGNSLAHNGTQNLFLRSPDFVDSGGELGGQALRFGVARNGGPSQRVICVGEDEDEITDVYYPAGPFIPAAYYLRYIRYFRGGLYIGRRVERHDGLPTVPPGAG